MDAYPLKMEVTRGVLVTILLFIGSLTLASFTYYRRPVIWFQDYDGNLSMEVLDSATTKNHKRLTQDAKPEEITEEGDTLLPTDVVSACTPSARLIKMQNTCRHLAIKVHTNGGIDSVIIDNVHRAVYIPNPKAGTKSMVAFLAHTIGESEMIRGPYQGYYLERGMNYTRHISPQELNRDYEDYFKYLIVRHPLQKFISGYFEKFLGRQACLRVASRLGRVAICDDRKMIPLADFTEAVSKGLVSPDHHWSSVQFSARPCDVSLDMILKTETMDTDGVVLNRRLGLTQGMTPDLTHVANAALLNSSRSFTASNLGKYDEMLAQLQRDKPRAFRWLLDYFQADMEMFGYDWNSTTGTSGCRTVNQNVACC